LVLVNPGRFTNLIVQSNELQQGGGRRSLFKTVESGFQIANKYNQLVGWWTLTTLSGFRMAGGKFEILKSAFYYSGVLFRIKISGLLVVAHF
jgi:hypothetical protein